MTTLREKGQQFQRWIKKHLEDKGYIVHNMGLTGHMLYIKGKKVYVSQKNDIFGCDLVARKGMEILWIQASLDSKVGKREEEFKNYFKQMNSNESVQLWIKTDRAINIKEFYPDTGLIDYGKIIRGKFYGLENI